MNARKLTDTLLLHFSLLCACYCLLEVSLLSHVLAIYLAFFFSLGHVRRRTRARAHTHTHTHTHTCARACTHTHVRAHTHALLFLYCLLCFACCYLLELSLVSLVVLAIHLALNTMAKEFEAGTRAKHRRVHAP